MALVDKLLFQLALSGWHPTKAPARFPSAVKLRRSNRTLDANSSNFALYTWCQAVQYFIRASRLNVLTLISNDRLMKATVLLASHIRQIGRLEILHNPWAEIHTSFQTLKLQPFQKKYSPLRVRGTQIFGESSRICHSISIITCMLTFLSFPQSKCPSRWQGRWARPTLITPPYLPLPFLDRPHNVPHITGEALLLFRSVDPLDGLTVSHCDLLLYFHSFLDFLKGATLGNRPCSHRSKSLSFRIQCPHLLSDTRLRSWDSQSHSMCWGSLSSMW